MKTSAETEVRTVETLTLTELCRFCDADTAWIVELVDHGALTPESDASGGWSFCAASIARARKARRLQRELGVNVAALALILDLLEERDGLRRRLAVLGAA